MIATLNPEIASHQRTQPALPIEGNFSCAMIIYGRMAGVAPPAEGELTEPAIWAQDAKLGELPGGTSRLQCNR